MQTSMQYSSRLLFSRLQLFSHLHKHLHQHLQLHLQLPQQLCQQRFCHLYQQQQRERLLLSLLMASIKCHSPVKVRYPQLPFLRRYFMTKGMEIVACCTTLY